MLNTLAYSWCCQDVFVMDEGLINNVISLFILFSSGSCFNLRAVSLYLICFFFFLLCIILFCYHTNLPSIMFCPNKKKMFLVVNKIHQLCSLNLGRKWLHYDSPGTWGLEELFTVFDSLSLSFFLILCIFLSLSLYLFLSHSFLFSLLSFFILPSFCIVFVPVNTVAAFPSWRI